MKKEKPIQHQLLDRFMKRFDTCTDAKISAAFNHEAVICGWGTATAGYPGARHKQLQEINFDNIYLFHVIFFSGMRGYFATRQLQSTS